MSCQFCEPYLQKIIEGQNGFCAITKNGELIAFPTDTKAEGVNSVKIKIKRCPMCGRDFGKEETRRQKEKCTRFSKMDLQRWLEVQKSKLEQEHKKCLPNLKIK